MRSGLVIFALFLMLAFFTFARKGPSARSAAPSTPPTPVGRALASKDSQAPATYPTCAPSTSSSATTAPTAEKPAKVDFATQVRPILEGKCQPCHFNGGTMYQRLPFDRPETIRTLSTKLFTRIRDESERRVIREFLAHE